MPEPIAVTTGFGWTAAGAWASFFALVAVIIRQIGPWRKQKIEASERLRDDLLSRVERLEQTLEQERESREQERARHDAERALDRHRLNNVTQCFDAMLMMIEATPEKASRIVEQIKEMRGRQIKAEAAEKAAIYAAAMTGSPKEEEE